MSSKKTGPRRKSLPNSLTIARIFDNKSPLTKAMPSFKPRAQQIILAEAILSAIANHSHFIAEAGTGTGKTFAYLVPALLSNKKIILSTATKALQDQLIDKDIPFLKNTLALPIKIHHLKGRQNYICRYRTLLYSKEMPFHLTFEVASTIQTIAGLLPTLKMGEQSELPNLTETESAWPYVTSTTANCLGTTCSEYEACYLVKARRKAQSADLLVINHHVFFSNQQLKEKSLGDMLPKADVIIFDEAHQLMDVATDMYAMHVSSSHIKIIVNAIMSGFKHHVEWKSLDSIYQNYLRFEGLLSNWFQDEGAKRLSFEDIQQKQALITTIEEWEAILDTLSHWLLLYSLKENDDHQAWCDEVILSKGILNRFLSSTEEIRWLDCFKQSLVIHLTPLTFDKTFRAYVDVMTDSAIFLSATLSVKGSFHLFASELGLLDVKTLQLDSPFPYDKHMLLYLPRGMPDVNSDDFYEKLVTAVLPIITTLKGRTFFLFTSYRGMGIAKALLEKQTNIKLLVQGEESKPILLKRFREGKQSILLGTQTFWEGIDVKGALLSCVIIDKIPFQSPNDPIVKGKAKAYAKKGMNAFEEWAFPLSMLQLKQGVGRLIRDEEDKGILVIGDSRCLARTYASTLFDSLPPMRKTRSYESVEVFMKELIDV
jgi:ATP-dependent DNA helicase DinG